MKKSSLRSLLQDRAVLAEIAGQPVLQAAAEQEGAQLDLLVQGKEAAVTDGPFTRMEAIILITGRPPLLVQDGQWETPKSKELRARIEPAKEAIAAAIPRVGRVEILDHVSDYVGTGWMVDEDVLITNRHVAELFAMRQGGAFQFRANAEGSLMKVRADFLREYKRQATARATVKEIVFLDENSEARPDMALVRLERDGTPLPDPIELDSAELKTKDNVAVIGYPAEDSRNDTFVMRDIFNNIYNVKRLSPGTIMGIRFDGRILEHDCTTLGGNSGSVVLNLATGKACGLHFSGSYLDRNLAFTSATIKARLAEIGARFYRIPFAPSQPSGAVAPSVRPPATPGLGVVSDDGEASRQSPLVRLNRFAREGYDASFLVTSREDEPLREAPLPEPGNGVRLAKVKDSNDSELKYTHFSVLMHQDRRLALFTACNIDGNRLHSFPREGDRWYPDDRLVNPNDQVTGGLYVRNALDRGHLVRRLDPAWGETRAEAAQAVEDTFFFTNCSPQHSRLNQKTWLSLEDYVLKNAATHDLKVCVFTGPVFSDHDRDYRGVKIPEEYWKVVVIVNTFTQRLSATAYLLSQVDYLSNIEFAYGQFRTYQRSVRAIEAKTGLSFGDLSRFDPLAYTEAPADRVIERPQDLIL